MMKTLFFPCTVDGLPKHTGSRMIRCEWVANNWEGAEVYDGTQRLKDYQLFVFQKAYLSEFSQKTIYKLAAWRDQGRAIELAFDLCDPDFLDESHRQRLLAVLPMFDFATAPTWPLAEWLGQYLPAYEVQDRVDTLAITSTRVFVPGPPRIVWMGYQGNMGALTQIAQRMEHLGITGEIVAVNAPMPFEEFLGKMTDYDILLNPRPNIPPYCYKSDNKTLIAWAAGVAVARDPDELEALLDDEKRRQSVTQGREYVWDGAGNIANAVLAWQRICECEGL